MAWSLADEDAKKIHKAIKGLGTDEQTIVDVVTKRNSYHFRDVNARYQTLYGKSLHDAIKSDTSGDFKDILVALTTPMDEYIAKVVHKATAGAGTDEGAIIDALCHASPYDIQGAKDAYRRMYNKNIDSDVKGDTSGDFKKCLIMLLQGNRGVGIQEPIKSARDLHHEGEGRVGTNDSFYITFFTTSSHEHIWATAAAYRQAYGHTLAEACDKELSGYYARLCKAIATPPGEFWAERIHKAVKGLGTNDKILKHAFTFGRMWFGYIPQAYHNLYKRSLWEDVDGDTTGWYCRTLKAVMNQCSLPVPQYSVVVSGGVPGTIPGVVPGVVGVAGVAGVAGVGQPVVMRQ